MLAATDTITSAAIVSLLFKAHLLQASAYHRAGPSGRVPTCGRSITDGWNQYFACGKLRGSKRARQRHCVFDLLSCLLAIGDARPDSTNTPRRAPTRRPEFAAASLARSG